MRPAAVCFLVDTSGNVSVLQESLRTFAGMVETAAVDSGGAVLISSSG